MKLESKVQFDEKPLQFPNGSIMLITPSINEDYWMFRVRLSEKQAIVGFPKFMTIGIGFQLEKDWNTNLPYSCDALYIYNHIKHNKCDKKITKDKCLKAIKLIQQAATEYKKL